MGTICPKCGYERQQIDTSPEHECPKCGVIYAKVTARDADMAKVSIAMRTGDWSSVPFNMIPPGRIGEAVQGLPVSTTHEIPGKQVVRSIDVITAECAFGINIFRDLFAGVSDVIGGRNQSTQTVLRDARLKVMAELRMEAFRLGANAIVGIDLDYSEFSGGGKSMLFVVATGTAVVVEKSEPIKA